MFNYHQTSKDFSMSTFLPLSSVSRAALITATASLWLVAAPAAAQGQAAPGAAPDKPAEEIIVTG